MYDKVVDADIILHNGKTGDYIGKTHFLMSPNTEKQLLDMLNYNQIPDTITLQDVRLYEPVANYKQPEPYKKFLRESTLNVIARDAYSGERIPVELRLKYYVMARAHFTNDIYYFDSIELSNIKIMGAKTDYP